MMAEANITTTTPHPPAQQEGQERCTIPTHNKKALSAPMAVRTLQRAWRRTLAPCTTQRLAEAYDRVLSIEYVRQIRYCSSSTSSAHTHIDFLCFFLGSFESLVVHLREKETIRIAKAMLQRVHLLCTLRHGSPPRALAPENVNVRVFLAGFMIAFRPTHVFESMG